MQACHKYDVDRALIMICMLGMPIVLAIATMSINMIKLAKLVKLV